MEAKEKWEAEVDHWEMREVADGLYGDRVKLPTAPEINLRLVAIVSKNTKSLHFRGHHRTIIVEYVLSVSLNFLLCGSNRRCPFGAHHGKSFIDPTWDCQSL
jgi:hypothetical protein